MEIPSFYLSYHEKGSREFLKEKSHKITSALKGEGDVILEFRSNLLSTLANKREELTMQFTKGVRTLGLNFRSRKVSAEGGEGIFSKLFSFASKTREAYEIFVHVPAEVWNTREFKEILPVNGIMYYFLKPDMDGNKYMEELVNGQIMDAEKLDIFDIIAFDCSELAHMGIFTSTITQQDLKTKLGLS